MTIAASWPPAIARLRAKIKYRPVVFELLPSTFTMLELQQAIEALAGQTLHKPNFRRLIEQQDLVEETGPGLGGSRRTPRKTVPFPGFGAGRAGILGHQAAVDPLEAS